RGVGVTAPPRAGPRAGSAGLDLDGFDQGFIRRCRTGWGLQHGELGAIERTEPEGALVVEHGEPSPPRVDRDARGGDARRQRPADASDRAAVGVDEEEGGGAPEHAATAREGASLVVPAVVVLAVVAPLGDEREPAGGQRLARRGERRDRPARDLFG